jgi:cytochrome c oxidase subunit III
VTDAALPPTELNEPWHSPARQRVAVQFGTWSFLATETLFFGAIFLVYLVARWRHPDGFVTGAKEADVLFGSVNTVVLITSSLTMAIAERAVRERLAGLARWMTAATIALGLCFLLVKGFEYRADLDKHLVPGPDFPLSAIGASQFWAFYWVATVVHATHLTIGLFIVARLLVIRVRELPERWIAAEGTALYWHLVDVVWVFLYPLLYLAGR